MIVVLDTNVIISSVLSRKGNPAKIIRRWQEDEFAVATSPSLIEELERALQYEQVQRYLKLSEEELAAFLKSYRSTATVVEPEISLDVVEKDPDDNRVLECAATAGAAYIVSGNTHLLELKEYEGIIILDPAAFLSVLPLQG